jgi:F0F1-type ATP synthase assembly protein I
MTGYIEDARRGAFRSVGWQLLAAVSAGLAGLLVGGTTTGGSALVGGVIVTLASLVLTVGVFGGKVTRDPQFFLMRLMLGEMLKLVVTAASFVVAIVVFKAAFGPMMLGFIASMAAYWTGLYKSSLGQGK